MPLHATTYRDTYQIHTNTGSVNDTVFSPHVNVLACIVVCSVLVCIVKRYQSILANVSIHTTTYNTYTWLFLYIQIQTVPVNTSKCINTYHNVQYLHMIVSIHTNTSRHILILAIHTIHTKAFQYRQTRISINTDTSRRIPTKM